MCFIFVFKQKTAYEMRISDWRSDVCSSDLLNALDALQIEKPVVAITAADIDRLIGNLRKARREFVEVARAAQNGDQVKVDFLGKIDGAAFEGGEGKDVQFELGEGRFLPELEAGIVGHAVGESFVVDVKFPEDYRSEEHTSEL